MLDPVVLTFCSLLYNICCRTLELLMCACILFDMTSKRQKRRRNHSVRVWLGLVDFSLVLLPAAVTAERGKNKQRSEQTSYFSSVGKLLLVLFTVQIKSIMDIINMVYSTTKLFSREFKKMRECKNITKIVYFQVE